MSGTPRVALLPGASGTGAFWKPVVDRLPANWPTTLFSWPGAGAEPHDAGVQRYEDLVGWTAAALVDGSNLVAQLMGGMVAIGVALATPESPPARLGGHLGRHRRRRPGHRGLAVRVRVRVPDRGAVGDHSAVDYGDAVATITARTCLIWGDADPVSPVGVGRQLHRLLPNSTMQVLAGGTHSLAHDQPDDVAALVVDHLR